MNTQKIKIIWEPKKMTKKICAGETLTRPWNYQTDKKNREELQGYDYLLYIAPIAREGGRTITANITVIRIPAPGEETMMPYYNNTDYVRFDYLMSGDATARGASFNMHHTFTLEDDDLNQHHEALDIFKYGVSRFREVFKNYLPAQP